MAKNTAIGAKIEQVQLKERVTCTITFKNEEHENFYKTYLQKCRYQDVYHKALVYCLGVDDSTRSNIKAIYDFKTGNVKTDFLHQGWITSGSARVIRMAYNLYNNGTPSVMIMMIWKNS